MTGFDERGPLDWDDNTPRSPLPAMLVAAMVGVALWVVLCTAVIWLVP